MVITYHGNGCVRLLSGGRTLLVDPQNARMKPDILLKTLSPWPLTDTGEAIGEKPSAALAKPVLRSSTATEGGEGTRGIVGPGEYEQQGVRVWGFPVRAESSEKFIKTIYLVEIEEFRLAFLGHLSAVPKPETFEEFGKIDILFVPAGGKPFLSAEIAAKLVKQLEPKIAVPIFAKSPKEFAKEFGQNAEPQERLTLKKKDLPVSGLKVIVLRET